ncbi:hypothetical protein P3T69_06785 [Lactiplantibacillus plantarum]|nr:hypothetical protein P3T69_06785 [Lactiplantibacillus plantarum]
MRDFFVIAFYAVTADPSGHFHLHWTLTNIYLTSAYFFGHPLLMCLLPRLAHNPFQMISVASRALNDATGQHQTITQIYHNAVNPVSSRDMLLSQNEYRDDMISISVSFVIHGCLLLLSWPLIGIILLGRGGKALIRRLIIHFTR